MKEEALMDLIKSVMPYVNNKLAHSDYSAQWSFVKKALKEMRSCCLDTEHFTQSNKENLNLSHVLLTLFPNKVLKNNAKTLFKINREFQNLGVSELTDEEIRSIEHAYAS
jgi:hypothetical protein